MSLFSSLQPPAKPTLFGSLGNDSQQSQQPFASLFGSQPAIQSQQQKGGFLNSATSQHPQQSGGAFGSMTGAPAPMAGAMPFNNSNQQPLGASTLQRQSLLSTFGASLQPREKTVVEQMQVLLEKWSPESQRCVFQRYFYNSVGKDRAPYFSPGPEEDEQKWEEALANRPDEGSIPVLCKGFVQLGERLKIQVQTVQSLQTRLHEINNSLTNQLQKHNLETTVRAADARRRHLVLSQRCLQLATKVQILRNRGYAMDGAEEDLRKRLVDLEKSAFDPQLHSRQEEIWARLVSVRERAQFLRDELNKGGKTLGSSEDENIDEVITQRAKKILADYESQIAHLSREVEEVRKDLNAWESGEPSS